jgi:hypothetical protein
LSKSRHRRLAPRSQAIRKREHIKTAIAALLPRKAVRTLVRAAFAAWRSAAVRSAALACVRALADERSPTCAARPLSSAIDPHMPCGRSVSRGEWH